jgi:hypothetical protein
MKNLPKFFATFTLLLGLVFQGICNGSSHLSHQCGYILLQSRDGLGYLVWFVIILFLLFIGIILEKAASAKLKNSTQQYELIKPIQDEWIKPIREDRIPSVSAWLGRFLTVIIPVVGLIALIVWAIDDRDKIRKNWAIAHLIFIIILIVLFYLLGGLFTAYLMKRIGRY